MLIHRIHSESHLPEVYSNHIRGSERRTLGLHALFSGLKTWQTEFVEPELQDFIDTLAELLRPPSLLVWSFLVWSKLILSFSPAVQPARIVSEKAILDVAPDAVLLWTWPRATLWEERNTGGWRTCGRRVGLTLQPPGLCNQSRGACRCLLQLECSTCQQKFASILLRIYCTDQSVGSTPIQFKWSLTAGQAPQS